VDALVFGATEPIKHVPLPDVDLKRLTELAGNIVLKQPTNALVNQRKSYTTRFLKPALQMVWNDIVIHIFEKMCILLVNTAVLPQC
jgi:hypothetical protein